MNQQSDIEAVIVEPTDTPTILYAIDIKPVIEPPHTNIVYEPPPPPPHAYYIINKNCCFFSIILGGIIFNIVYYVSYYVKS